MVVAANRDDVVQAQRLATVTVSINSDGAQRQLRTAQTTVGATLREAEIELGPRDVVTPALSERPREGMKITVVRVRETIESVKEPIAFDTAKRFTKSLRPGQVRQTRSGAAGEKLAYYRMRYENGVPVSRVRITGIMTRRPASRVVSIGSRGRYTSRGEFHTRRVMRMSATAYDPGPRSCGRYATGRTACGLRAGYGVAAVDPRIIPLGSRLYVEGYGYALAGDKGRAIKGNRIDLGFDSYHEACHFGRKSVIVHVLEE
jgi:3D (Asp-Asp-Asp) domain-containing protein